MNYSNRSLKPAHRGYRYQDIATAYMLVRSLVDNYDEVIVDRKQVDGDVIDDLEVKIDGNRVRRQFKYTDNKERFISVSDFKNASSILPIDKLVLTHVRDKGTPIIEYRLCTTWCLPAEDDDIHKFLTPSCAESTFLHSRTDCYHFIADQIWPEDQRPVWKVLDPFASLGAEFKRQDFLDFCDKFIIEVGLPFASTDLANPNDFENELLSLLADRIGIGKYPNQGRRVEDVAALALSLANLARTSEEKLTPYDVELNLKIRTDFGRISQSFPVDNSVFYNRPDFRKELKGKILDGGVHLITAEPGAGKSWELTRLAEELQDANRIVARHYCYLEPGDDLVERRVTTDVFYGNVLAEINDAYQNSTSKRISQYSVGLNELEQVFREIQNDNFSIILIIDGLDHIARVRSSSSNLNDVETDIIEQIASLNLPNNVSIVIGSQPGEHLEPLRDREDLIEYKLPSWSDEEVIGLAQLHDLNDALNSILEPTNQDSFLNDFSRNCSGNPLYTHYLSNTLVNGIQEGIITNPFDWLSSYPELRGDIATYYEHLYSNASKEAQVIADLFGVLDFSVSLQELKSIVPVFKSWLPTAITALTPVLTSTTSQGGLRVFHESFRRFMLDEIKRQGRELTDILEPVITWLEKLGFYKNAKTYRFLLPALRRAKREEEVLQYVDSEFISTSLAFAYPQDAIQKNLALAADIAGSQQNWPILVRCNELRRTLSTTFENEDELPDDYWKTYLALFGAEKLSERLLFEGRPVVSALKGLNICSIIDNEDGVAPWKEYLAIPRDKVKLNQALDIIQGHIRLGNYWKIAKNLYTALFEKTSHDDDLFVRKLSALLATTISPKFVEKIASRSTTSNIYKNKLPSTTATLLMLGVSDYYQKQSNTFEQAVFANKAIKTANTISLVLGCFSLRANPLNAKKFFYNPNAFDISIEEDSYISNDNRVNQWIREIRYIAIFTKNKTMLHSQLKRVNGEGWYRCWLRFVIKLSEAEAAQNRGDNFNIIKVFEELLQDTSPFTGSPRASDLYSLEWVISNTLKRGLALVETKEAWKAIIEILAEVNNKISTRISREDGSPFSRGDFLEILLPYIQSSIATDLVKKKVRELTEDLDLFGSFYSVHAEYTMKLARIQNILGDTRKAKENWKKTNVFLTGYGFRKDRTLVDIIETVPSLSLVSKKVALQAIYDLQPLVYSVIRHAERTKHIPSYWFDSLLEIDQVSAIKVLSLTFIEDHGIENWVTVNALKRVLQHVDNDANPTIIDALWQTVLLEIESEGYAEKTIKNRLSPIEKLSAIYPEIALKRVTRLISEVEGDSDKHRKEGGAALQKVLSTSVFSTLAQPVTQPKQKKTSNSSRKEKTTNDNSPVFQANRTLVNVFTSLRKIKISRNSDDLRENAIHSLSYILSEMIGENREEDAYRTLYFFVRETGFLWHPEPIYNLAQILFNAGHKNLSAVAYSLAFTHAKGDGGRLAIGGKEHCKYLKEAVTINRELALQTVANEIAYRFRAVGYGFGISQSLIKRIAEWGDPDTAYEAWKEAFNVISRRLPLPPKQGWFAKFKLDETIDWSIDEALISVLLIRIAEPRLSRKNNALLGLVRIVQYYPDDIIVPLDWWLSRDTYISSILLVFEMLLNAEKDPYVITCGIEERLKAYAVCSNWGINRLSKLLLERAGLTIPSRTPEPFDTAIIDSIVLDEEEYGKYLHFDSSNSLRLLNKVWPELDSIIAKYMHIQIDGSEIQKERIGEVYKLSYGSRNVSLPPTPVLHWGTEIFISSLHELLFDFKEQLWKKGKWVDDSENQLLMAVIPDTAIHLAYAASRVSRPNYPKPNELSTSQNIPFVINDDRSEYDGWIRLALQEEEYIHDPDSHFGPPIEVVQVFSNVVSKKIGEVIPENTFPFKGGGNKNDWWDRASDPSSLFFGLHGRLAGSARIEDWLGNFILLIPPAVIHNFMDVNTPKYGDPLIWSDQESNPVVVMRTWRVRSTKSLDAEPDEITGCDLIVRSDVAKFLNDKCFSALVELSFVNKKKINV